MSTGKCSNFIALSLYPLVFLSIIFNIVLFFPAGETRYVKEGHITPEVKYMGGVLGGGVVVFIASLFIHLTGQNGCCGNRFGMFMSIAFAGMGLVGGMYSFIVAAIGVYNGPLCLQASGEWGTPFTHREGEYLRDHSSWDDCTAPRGIVQFNLGLFITLMVISGLQCLLCASQVINGLLGCVCGAGTEKRQVA
ncbi:transmembrane 4 L6 family member 4-like [Neosynchiropus ocellatus]